MIKVKDLHTQETVKAAVEYIKSGMGFTDLRCCFNQLCKDWDADEYDPDLLSLSITGIDRMISEDPWIKDIAAMPAYKRTSQMTERVADEFIAKYWPLSKEKITSRMISDALRVADPLSRRHILAQRVVIECIHALQTETELHRLDRLMDALATDPRLEEFQY